MDVRPILLSFQTAIIAILFTFVLGTGVAYIVFRLKNRKLKILLNSLFTLPLVLPPTVFGFFLLTIFGVQQPVGQFLLDFFAIQVVFSWPATVIAAVAVSFPLMYRSALTAFEQMDSELLAVAQTLGFSESRYFRKIAFVDERSFGRWRVSLCPWVRRIWSDDNVSGEYCWQNKNASFSYLLCCSKWGLALSQSICCNYVITLPDYFIFYGIF